MPATDLSIQSVFATNRAEELGLDVWRAFVVPPFFERLTVGETKKPKVIIGGRGCGKTMLLRYLSHDSSFSPDRDPVPEDALRHIGIYWRADTQFASLLQHRNVETNVWESAFRHLAAIILGKEILFSLVNIANSSLRHITHEDISAIDFSSLRAFDPKLPDKLPTLQVYLDEQLIAFEVWANNVKKLPEPLFIPGHQFLKRLVDIIRRQVPLLQNGVFFIYIDEYENLAEYQAKIVNTWIKHSEPPLIFNLAMKRNGFQTRATEGRESLNDIHDFRYIDLEDFGSDRSFMVFAAEILLHLLQQKVPYLSVVDPNDLREPRKLNQRRAPEYTNAVLAQANRLFPSLPYRELAQSILSDSNLRKRLIDRVGKALETKGESPTIATSLVSNIEADAAIILPALLRRNSPTVKELLKEIESLSEGRPNKFTGATNWIHNNLFACILQLYDGLGRACPLYSGFETYCQMAHGNVRHFLELCHQSLIRSRHTEESAMEVAIPEQAEAAGYVSSSLLPEVRSFGLDGNNLHTFLLRLGTLFALAQQQPAQSEPEKTHFSIIGGEITLGESEQQFLREAVKWSVLFEEKGTKKKESDDPEDVEYVLNPIYAPYFHISYRKGRKLELSHVDVQTLISGEYELVKRLLRDYKKRWDVDLDRERMPLFAHLEVQD